MRRSFVTDFAATFDKAYENLRAAGVATFELDEKTRAQMNDRLQVVVDEWVAQVGGRGLPAAEMLDAYKARLAAAQ